MAILGLFDSGQLLDGRFAPEMLEALLKRLRSLDPSPVTWNGAIDARGAFSLRRTEGGVSDAVSIDPHLLKTSEAHVLKSLHADLKEVYLGSCTFYEKATALPLRSPLALLETVTATGRKGLTISRYKGLGEMVAEQLWETTLDPDARTLLQIKMHHRDEVEEIFSTLMGDVVEPRRRFIQENAMKVANLDA